MAELHTPTTARLRSGWILWLIWVAATCAGVLVMSLTVNLSQLTLIAGLLLLFGRLSGILILNGVAQLV